MPDNHIAIKTADVNKTVEVVVNSLAKFGIMAVEAAKEIERFASEVAKPYNNAKQWRPPNNQ